MFACKSACNAKSACSIQCCTARGLSPLDPPVLSAQRVARISYKKQPHGLCMSDLGAAAGWWQTSLPSRPSVARGAVQPATMASSFQTRVN